MQPESGNFLSLRVMYRIREVLRLIVTISSKAMQSTFHYLGTQEFESGQAMCKTDNNGIGKNIGKGAEELSWAQLLKVSAGPQSCLNFYVVSANWESLCQNYHYSNRGVWLPRLWCLLYIQANCRNFDRKEMGWGCYVKGWVYLRFILVWVWQHSWS